MKKNKYLYILLSIFIITFISIITIAHNSKPTYIPYNENNINIIDNNGIITVEILENSLNYSIRHENSYEKQNSLTYYISLHENNISKLNKQNHLENTSFILNKNDEIVTNVYYSNNGTGDIGTHDYLLYGTQNRDVFGISLQHLALAYYLGLSFIIGIIALVICKLIKKSKFSKLLTNIYTFCFCFVFSTFLIKGFDTSSYQLIMDLSFIIIVSINLFIISLLTIKIKKCHLKYYIK